MRPNIGRPCLLACALLLGCAQSQGRARSALDTAFVIKEVTQTGEVLDVPAEGITEVDINSALVLEMNEAAIQGAVAQAPQAPAAGGSTAVALAERLEKVGALLDQQREMLARLQALAQNPSPSRAELDQYAQVESSTIERVVAFAEARDPEQADAILSQPGYAGVVAYLQQELQGAAAEHAALLGSLGSYRWRMQASLRGTSGSEPVHLANYDSVAVGDVDIKNKLRPVLDEQTQRELALAQGVAQKARTLDGFTKLIASEVRSRAEALVEHLEAGARTLQERVERLEGVKLAEANARALMTQIDATAKAGRGALDACKAALPVLKAALRAPGVAAVQRVLGASQGCVEALEDVAAQAQQAEAAARALASDTDLRALMLEAQAQVSALRQEALSVVALRQVLGVAEKPLAAPAWAPADLFNDQSLKGLLASRLELTRTPRQVGSQVSVQGLILDGDSGAVSVEGPQRSLEVVQNGLQINVSASVLFVQPTELAGNEDEFRAAPAMAGALHYRCARGSGRVGPSGGCAVWNFFNPGLGLHATTLVLGELSRDAAGQQQAGNVQTPHLAGGVVAQLFGDLFQGGVGYDLQSARSYWFFGVGIQTLTDLGFDFAL